MLRRRLLTATVAAPVAALAGCARDTGAVTLRFWAMGREGAVAAELVRGFEREHPGVRVKVEQLPWTAAPDDALPAASAALRRADGDAGVLVLTDLYGASPSNLAARLSRLGTPVRRAAGLNLPMLLRALNYPELDLDSLAATALAGCRNGAIADDA